MDKRKAGAIGAQRRWANALDRKAAMAPVWRNGPAGYDWHARKLFGTTYDELNAERQQRVVDARKAFYDNFVAAGRIATQRLKATRLREKAASLLAEADRLDKGDHP